MMELLYILINHGRYTNLSIHLLELVKAQTAIDVGNGCTSEEDKVILLNELRH